jgi:hypothetical protein
MIGAILVSGFVAAMSSFFATLSNFVVARKFPDFGYELDPDVPEAVFVRITCYRVVAKLFYWQGLFFWTLFAVLLIVRFLPSLNVF